MAARTNALIQKGFIERDGAVPRRSIRKSDMSARHPIHCSCRFHRALCMGCRPDIACPKRLGRVFRRLKRAGVPLQYSVFSVIASPGQLGALMAELARLIHPLEDDVRAYRVPEPMWKVQLGKPILLEDTLILEQDSLR